VTDALETVLNQVGVEITVAVLIEVFGVDFGNHEFDIELLAEFFRFTKFKDSFFEVVVRWNNSDHDIDVRRYFGLHRFNKLLGVVAAAGLNRRHLEILADKVLIRQKF
jgi:hypothetical protein